MVRMFRYQTGMNIVMWLLLLGGAYLLAIRPWMANWGSTIAERQMVLPGDNFHPNSETYLTQAVTIHAPSDVVWQWVIQIGQDRAGFYSYTWLENIIGCNIHNADRIHPEWQHLAVGDGWRMAPLNYLGGVGKSAVSKIRMIDPGRTLVLDIFGTIEVMPVDKDTTRLIMRGYSGKPNLITTMIWDPLVFTMGKRMLLGIEARAEGRPDVPMPLLAIAWLGWAMVGIIIVVLFLRRQSHRPLLILPILTALPAVLTSGDIQAGLAAFLAVGIIVLGFLTYGKSWWGMFVTLGSVVLLILLLAPEAYSAYGLGFALLLTVGQSANIASRLTRSPSSPRSQIAG